MQTGKNVGDSAKAGMEKTKATAQEKVEKMSTQDPMSKEMATEKKDARIQEAELEKQQQKQHNAGATGQNTGRTTGGTFGQGGN